MTAPLPKATVHLGPPKTGTSSLQYALQALSGKKIIYLGIKQPRVDFDSVFRNLDGFPAEALHLLVSSQIGSPPSGTLNRMPSFLVSRKKTIPLVLSEEMFMVDQDSGVRWQTKIRKLGLFMRETDTVPLIVLRDPQEATPSLQRELGFGKKHHIWTAILSALVFPFTNAARVYDYRYVFKVLKDAHFKEVRLVSFDQLTSGYIPLTSITGHPDSAQIRIGHENKAPDNQTVGAYYRYIWKIYPLRGRRRFYTNILANISSEANNQFSLGRLGKLGTPGHRL